MYLIDYYQLLANQTYNKLMAFPPKYSQIPLNLLQLKLFLCAAFETTWIKDKLEEIASCQGLESCLIKLASARNDVLKMSYFRTLAD
jgi:hypothetical protein